MVWQNQIHQPHDSETAWLVAGKTFGFSDEITIPANTTVDLNFKLSSKDVLIQFVQVGELTTNCEVIGFADSDLSDIGTEITGKTANMRYSGSVTKTPTAKLYSAPTVTSDGFRMTLEIALGSAQGVNLNPAAAGMAGQFILKSNTNNVFRITNRDANTATQAMLRMRWVEDDI